MDHFGVRFGIHLGVGFGVMFGHGLDPIVGLVLCSFLDHVWIRPGAKSVCFPNGNAPNRGCKGSDFGYFLGPVLVTFWVPVLTIDRGA